MPGNFKIRMLKDRRSTIDRRMFNLDPPKKERRKSERRIIYEQRRGREKITQWVSVPKNK